MGSPIVRHVYLDHAATTAVRPEALEAFTVAARVTGNPSAVNHAGRAARRVVEESREAIAAAVGAQPPEVILTSGGTEADNLAVKGGYWSRRAEDARRSRLVVSAVEHHAVLDAARWLRTHDGATVVEIPVDGAGRVDVAALDAELARHGDEVALVSVMWANNEVGTLQPVSDVVRAARDRGIPVHSDAVQAVGHVPVDMARSGVAALSLSGHKLGAPVGTGALIARRDLALTPLLHGGGQERGVRSGTMSAAAAAALAAAVESAVAEAEAEAVRVAGLRDRLVAGLLGAVDGVTVRGAAPGPDRLPGNAHVTVSGCDSEVLLFLLDSAGIAASSGSACRAGVEQRSHVLLAMGVPDDEARGALRLTLGRTTTADDVDAVLAVFPETVRTSRRVAEKR